MNEISFEINLASGFISVPGRDWQALKSLFCYLENCPFMVSTRWSNRSLPSLTALAIGSRNIT